jgi:TetR/AcrR family transcriptional repressor of nem operon
MSTAPEVNKPQRRGDTKRQLLVDIGTAIFTQKGFSSTGLDEIVQAAEVPKGSFYYYFGSKEAFAQEVIRNYASYFAKKLDRTLRDESLSPLQRLKAFTADATRGVSRFEFKRGCLVGNLGQEMASLEDEFRVQLLGVLNDWRGRFKECIDEAKAIGEIATPVDSAALAHFFWSAWEGAVLCAKLEESTHALENVSELFFDHMLQPLKGNQCFAPSISSKTPTRPPAPRARKSTTARSRVSKPKG